MYTEGLNPIRLAHECYIDYIRKAQSFHIYGTKLQNVQEASDRIHGVLCEVASKQRCLGPNAAKIYMVIPPSSEQFSKDVHLEPNHGLRNRQITVQRLPENVGVQCFLSGRKPPQRFLAEWDRKRETILKANSVFLKKVVQRGLDDTLYCRTHLVMKVNFGTLVLFGYQKPAGNSQAHDTEYFLEMMREKGIQAELIRQ